METKKTSSIVFKEGVKVFNSSEKFVRWLNSYSITMNCKPISLMQNSEGLQQISDELNRIDHGLLS